MPIRGRLHSNRPHQIEARRAIAGKVAPAYVGTTRLARETRENDDTRWALFYLVALVLVAWLASIALTDLDRITAGPDSASTSEVAR